MPKYALDLTSIRTWHRAGNLQKAKKGYLALLKRAPQNAEILHGLGIICTQEKNFSAAREYLQKALRHQPNDPSIALNLANILKIQGLFAEAAELLHATIKVHATYAPAFNNLGTVYYALGKIEDAIHFYRKTITLAPEYIDAHYNLAGALRKQNLLEEARNSYLTLLKYTPEHFAARFQLGCVYMQLNQFPLATEAFLMVEKNHPHHFETQTNLATCYLKQGALPEAKTYYLNALTLNPKDCQILFNLGVICMQQGLIDASIPYYQRAIAVNKDLFAAHNNLAIAYLAKYQANAALLHFKETLRLQPEAKGISYMIDVLSKGKAITRAPSDYIQSLFDAYAEHYELHLIRALDYKIPDIFMYYLKSMLPAEPILQVLDLGCGTGLCGAALKFCAKKLVGVDLSPNMLTMARQKHIYDDLITADILTFIQEQQAKFDLILAGDVLVYIGTLETLFACAHKALNAHGVFIFNAEISNEEDFKMNQSGRFSHHKNYLDALAKKCHFKILNYTTLETRKQNNLPVTGHLYVLLREAVLD